MGILEVSLRGAYDPTSQLLINRFFYVIPGPGEEAQTDLEDFADQFELLVGQASQACCASSVRYVGVKVKSAAQGLEHNKSFDPQLVGTMPGASELAFYVMKFKLNRVSPSVRSGNKALSGVVADNFSDSGFITDAGQDAAITLYQAAIQATISLASGFEAIPILTRGYDPITGIVEALSFIGATPFTGLSTQKSRQRRSILT